MSGEERDEVLEAEVVGEERGGRQLRRVLFTAALLAVIGLAGWWLWTPVAERLGDLGTHKDRRALPREPTVAETPVTPAGIPTATDLSPLLDQLQRQETALAALERRIEALERDMAALAARRTEPGRAETDGSLLLAVALARIALKLDAGGDLLAERLALKALQPRLPEPARAAAAALIAASGPVAAGLPDRARMLALFAEAADALRGASRPQADGSWWRRWLAAIEGLVTVRPSGSSSAPGAASPADAALALARARYLAGDLDAAVEALDSMGAEVPPAVAELRRMLATRRAIAAALDELVSVLETESLARPLDAPHGGGGAGE